MSIVDKAREHGDFVTGDDGYVVFWPENRHGYYTAANLRELADELDYVNAPWDRQVNEYFDANGLPDHNFDDGPDEVL